MKHALSTLDVVPGHAGRVRCDAHWRIGRQWSNGLRDYDYWYIWAGRGRMKMRGGTVELYAGRALWLWPGQVYEAEQEPGDHLGVTFLHFRLKRGKRLLAMKEFVPPGEVFDIRTPDYFESASYHAVQLFSNPASSLEGSLLLKSLLLEMVAESKHPPEHGQQRHHREVIMRSVAMVQERLSAPPSVQELAENAGYSPDHFSRLFQQVTGQSPKELIIRCRMERALVLLLESSQTISQISDTLGYDDVAFFSRQFKQKMGTSPSRFRRK